MEIKIVSETIGLRLIKIVAFTIYAPADRFFRIELSRVNEATFYGISIFWLLPDYNKIKAEALSNSLLLLKYLHFYVTQIDLLWEAVLIVFSLIISTQHIPAVYSITPDRFATTLTLCNIMLIKNHDLFSYRFSSEFRNILFASNPIPKFTQETVFPTLCEASHKVGYGK